MLRAQRLFHGAKDKPLTAVLADLRARWARVLELPDGAHDVRLTSAELAPRVRDAFAAPRPG